MKTNKLPKEVKSFAEWIGNNGYIIGPNKKWYKYFSPDEWFIEFTTEQLYKKYKHENK